MSATLRVDYDDSVLDVIEKINQLLSDENVDLYLKDDGKEHNGFILLTLEDVAPS